MKIYWIDLFSGAGGTTTGIHLADNNVEVIACVNHDENAIKSHAANHPGCKHFIEDVRDIEVVYKLKKLVNDLRLKDPQCFVNIWASLECTNYSKAKGGLPRDADSRTLAHALFPYIETLKPEYLVIENVREFMAWGPLDDTGRPVSMKNGSDYIKWLNKVKACGYSHDYRLLNAADFGAYTSRERYFGIFAKKTLPISWPTQTHSKNADTMFDGYLKPWKAVKDVLDLNDEGKSIFDRPKPLVDATLKRIYAGLMKFVANGDDTYLQKYYSGRPEGKVIPVKGPAGSLTTVSNQAVVKVKHFLKRYNGGDPKHKTVSVDEPAGSLTTSNRYALVNLHYLQSYYGNGGVHSSEGPCPTITTKDRLAKVSPQFFSNYYGSGGQLSSINEPCPTVMGIPKQRLTTIQFFDRQYGKSQPSGIEQPAGSITTDQKLSVVKVEPWIMDTNSNNIGFSVNNPSRVITANRKQHYLVNVSIVDDMDRAFAVVINAEDSPTMKKIKEFMAIYGIYDIKMRMLKINELLKIQGFPEDYVLIGTKTEQKKYIGNAVVPLVAREIARSMTSAINKTSHRFNIISGLVYDQINMENTTLGMPLKGGQHVAE